MKPISLLIGALAIAFSSLFAQQMVPTPVPRETSPEPMEESTPEPTASPAALEKPAVRSASKTKAEPSTAASPAEKKQTSASKPSTTEANSSRSTGKKSVEGTLKEMENKWEAAIVAHDADGVAGLIAPDFAGINSKGKFVNKRAMTSEVRGDKDTYTSSRLEKLNVHRYGDTIATVTGSAHSKGTTKDGKPFDRTYRFTDTWVERNGQWQCVASQELLLGDK